MKLASALLGTTMLFAAAPALAQTTGRAEAALDEVVVTAQRREEALQSVPVAVSALNEQAIERLNARDIRDLTGRIPNLVLNEVNIGPSMSQVSIRGVNSQDPEKSFDPAVGVFIDGIYLGTSAFNLLDSFDLQRIEVLRGPQGTLFGRNTTGGAINAFRTEPTGEFGGKASVTIGTADRRDFRTVLNAPLVEGVLAAKLSGFVQKDDGVYKNSAGGSKGARDRWAFSTSLKWTPNSNLKAVLTYDHAKDESDLSPYSPRGVSTISPLPVRITQTTFPTPATIVPGFAPDIYCVVANRCEEKISSVTDPHFQNSRLDAVTANLDYALTPTLDLEAVLGWRKSREAVYIDFDGTDRTVFNAVRAQDYEQQSAEVRLASKLDGPINFVAGVFGFHSQYALRQAIKLDVRMTGAAVPLGAAYVNGSGDEDHHAATTTAVFGQVDWKFTDQLTLTAGGRATWDKKRIYTVFYGAPFGTAAGAYSVAQGVPAFRTATSFGGAKEDWFEFTPKVGLNYKASDDLLYYASYTRGYNAGGFSARAGTVADVTTPFDPEYIDAFEAGVKADLMDRRLRVNVAAFWNKYKDKQEEAIQPGPPPSFTSTTVRNVAGARIAGLEFETSAVLSQQLRVDATLGYMDAEYTNYRGFLASAQYISTPAQPAGTLIAADFGDLELRRTPEWTWSVTPTYTAELGPGVFTATGTVRHTSHMYSEIFNSARGRVPAQTFVDVSASYEFGGPQDDTFRLTGFVKNLGDVEDFTSFTNSLVDFGLVNVGRTWGLELQARF